MSYINVTSFDSNVNVHYAASFNNLCNDVPETQVELLLDLENEFLADITLSSFSKKAVKPPCSPFSKMELNWFGSEPVESATPIYEGIFETCNVRFVAKGGYILRKQLLSDGEEAIRESNILSQVEIDVDLNDLWEEPLTLHRGKVNYNSPLIKSNFVRI